MISNMIEPQDKKKPTSSPATGAGAATSGEYTLTGDQDTDLENIARHYKPADADDVQWRGMWKTVFEGESGGNLMQGESTYGKLARGDRATGGMQVLPTTAKGLGFSDEEFQNPYYRFMAGVKNLRAEWDEIGKDKRVTSPEHRAALTFAAYHAGRGNVKRALDAGGDGVPDVDDGGINTRDYTLQKTEALQAFLDANASPQSDEPRLVDEPVTDESGQPITTEQPAEAQRPGFKGFLSSVESAPKERLTLEEELVNSDRRFREQLGLIVPSTAPRNFTGKTPKVTFEVQRNEDGSFNVDENILSDAVAFALTGDNTIGNRFRQETGENVGAFLGADITNRWLTDQIQNGNVQVSEVGGKFYVQGNVPTQNYVKERLKAFESGGVEEVNKITSQMNDETKEYERLAAEESYGRRVAELRAEASKSEKKKPDEAKEMLRQAAALEAELEAKYPTDILDETWRGFKSGLARGMYNIQRTGFNLKDIIESTYSTDEEKKAATARDKRVRRMEQALNSATPQARRWLGQATESLTSELIYAPTYIAGGMMMGPAGGIMTSALRSANKPMDEAMQDIAASIFEVVGGTLLKGALTAGKNLSPRKEFAVEVGSGGLTEAGGDALIDLAQGKAIDWNNALMNLVIGGAMEAGTGAREAINNQAKPEGEGEIPFDNFLAPRAFDTEVRSPIFMSKTEDGEPRFGAIIRQGDSVGFVEIPAQHPIIIKHARDVEQGKASFIGVDTKSFDNAQTEWKGNGAKIKLPTMTSEEFANYLNEVNPLTRGRDAKLKQAINQGEVDDEIESEADDVSAGFSNQAQQEQEGQEIEKEPVSSIESGERSGKPASDEVLTKPKTFRKYNHQQHGLDEDLAKQWDEAEAERNAILKSATTIGQNGKINQGAMIQAGIAFSNVRKDILAEQAKRDKAAEGKKPEGSQPSKPTEDFKAGRVVTSSGVQVRLPADLSKAWNRVDDDFKAATETVRDDAGLTLPEKQRKQKDLKTQKLAEQKRILNEYRTREEEQTNRGYLPAENDRPVAILEDRGDDLLIRVGDDTRVVPRDTVETRKERALKQKSEPKLPFSVRVKARFGAFNESRPVSKASDGVVYVNDKMRSQIEDALGIEIGSADGFTFKPDMLEEVVDTLESAGLKKVADQLVAQKEAANGRPALIAANSETAGLALQHERIHQKASDKDLPRSTVEKIFSPGSAAEKLVDSSNQPIGELENEDIIQEILAYGLTGDYEGLGVEAEVLYDALLDVIQGYISAYPSEDLNTIFDNAIVDVDAIKNEANRKIKYADKEPQRSKKAVSSARKSVETGEQRESEESAEGKVRQKDRTAEFGYKYGEGNILNEVWKTTLGRPENRKGAPIDVSELRDTVPELTKEQFDRAVEFLASKSEFFLHRHDYPSSLSKEQRDKLVEINGTYYTALTIPDDPGRFGYKRYSVKDAKQYEKQIPEDLREILRKPASKVTKSDVKKIVEKGKFAVMSGSTSTSARDVAKTKNLIRELEKMGYKAFETTEGEPSIFVMLNNSKDIANMLRLGARYKQNQVLIGDEGSYRAPFTTNTPYGRLGNETFSKDNEVLFGADAAAQEGKTVVKTSDGDITFSVPDAFGGKRKQAESERTAVAEITRAYKRSFKNRSKSNTGAFIDWLKLRKAQGKRKDMSVKNTGDFLVKATEEQYGKAPDPNIGDIEYNAVRTRRAVRDGVELLKYTLLGKGERMTSQETGLSWYAASIKKMHEITAQAFPETMTQPQLRTLFDLMLAISSPANKVQANYNYATTLWRRMIEEFNLGLEGTLLPTARTETKTEVIDGKKVTRNLKYGRFGPHLEKMNYMSQGFVPIPSTDVEQYRNSGVTVRQSEAFKDISGAQQWYAQDSLLQKHISKYGSIGGVLEYLLEPGRTDNDPYRATEVLGPKVGAFFLNIAGFSQLVTVDMWASRWFYRINGDLMNPEEKVGVQDQPKGSDGDIIRGSMQAIAREWNRRYPEVKVTPADVQAILWYAEKDVWHLAGSRDSGTIDFADAAQKRVQDITADVSGAAEIRQRVIDKWSSDAPDQGPNASQVGTPDATDANRDFFVRQMSSGARLGLAHTTRKQVVNNKLKAFDAVEWNKLAERAKGDALDQGEMSTLYGLLQQGYQATTDQSREKVTNDLLDFLNNISGQSLGEFILLLRKAGMLSGIKTTGRNILSNTAFAILEEMKRGISGPIDLTIALARGRERAVQGMSPIGVSRALAKALTKGFVKGGKTLIGKETASFEDLNYDPKLKPSAITFGKFGAAFLNKTVGVFAKYVFRFQKAQDVVFREYAYNRAIYEIAALNKKNSGRPIADTLANPTVDESDLAWRMAEVAVFQNDNALNTAYQRFKNKQPKPVRYLLDYRLPFIKTGSNIFARTMDYLGVGGVYNVMKVFSDMDDKQFKGAKAKLWEAIDNPVSRKIIVEAFSRGLVGLGIAAMGWFLASAGLLNGMDDDDEKERQKRIAQGSGPGHLRIGDKWIDIRSLSPVGTLMLSGASAWRAMNKEMKDESKRYDAMLAVASSIVVDGLPLARAVSDFTNPKSGRSIAQSFIGAESAIPAIVAEYAAHRDDVQRETKGDSLSESIKKGVKARIPGKREELDAKTDVFGRELEQPSGFDPFATKSNIDNKVLKEATEVGWSMTPPKRDTKNNESRTDFNKRKKKTQDLITKVFESIVNDPGYSKSGFSKDERKAILTESAGVARETISQGGTISQDEMRDIVDAIVGKAKDKAEIDKDKSLQKEDKDRAKQGISTRYSKFISPATKD